MNGRMVGGVLRWSGGWLGDGFDDGAGAWEMAPRRAIQAGTLRLSPPPALIKSAAQPPQFLSLAP